MLPLHFNHLSPPLLAIGNDGTPTSRKWSRRERMQRNFSRRCWRVQRFSPNCSSHYGEAAMITTAADIYIRVYCNWRNAAAAGNSRNNCPAFFSPFFILGGRAGEMKGAGVAATQWVGVCERAENNFHLSNIARASRRKRKRAPFLSRRR